WRTEPPLPASTMAVATTCVATNMLTRLISTCRRMLGSGIVRNCPPRTPPGLFTRSSSAPNRSSGAGPARGCARRADLVAPHDIARDAQGSAPEPLDRRLRRLAPLGNHVEHDDVGTEAGEAEGYALPDAPATPGHERDLVAHQDVRRIDGDVLDVARHGHELFAIHGTPFSTTGGLLRQPLPGAGMVVQQPLLRQERSGLPGLSRGWSCCPSWGWASRRRSSRWMSRCSSGRTGRRDRG